MAELTKKVAGLWRSFFSSEEGQVGLAWILERRPKLTEKSWQNAAGFEKFHELIVEILEYEQASKSGEDDEQKGLRV